MPGRLMIILDGLGDCPIQALEGRTPLEAARTPYLDRLVTLGRCGLVDPIAPDVRVGTHVGAGVLMGLEPEGALHLVSDWSGKDSVDLFEHGQNGQLGFHLIDASLFCNGTYEVIHDVSPWG